jgi:HK97 family phage portal protein
MASRFWQRIRFIFGGASGTRQPGLQYGFPSVYSKASAVPVSEDTAMQLSAVWASVRLLSEAVAGMPVNVYRVSPDGTKEKDAKHYLSRLFNGRVNRYQNRLEFFETMTMQLALHGNCYALKQKNGAGEIIGLLPLMSGQMEVTLTNDGALVYQYTDGVNVTVYSSESIWHVRLFGNGVIGLSPLAYARNSIGIGLASENRVTDIFSNGGKPAGVLTFDKLLTQEQREQIKTNFRGMAEGTDDKLYVLEAGMQYQQISMSPKDIELLASRRFQIEDVARFFGVPSVMINDTAGTTVWGSGIYEIVQGFYKLGLRPYLERYEESARINLLSIEERETIIVEFDFEAFLQASLSDRLKMYGEGVKGGVMTVNEGRAREGWEPVEGGDEVFMQAQMRPLRLLLNGPITPGFGDAGT